MDKREKLITEAISLLEKHTGKKVILSESLIEGQGSQQYLNEVERTIKGLVMTWNKLVGLWHDASDYDLDLNDFLQEGYPFEKSFDEYDMNGWLNTANSKLSH